MEDTLLTDQVNIINDTVTLIAINFYIPMGTYPAMYVLDLFEDNHVLGRYEFLFIMSKPFVTEPPEDITLCYGEDAIFEVTTYEPESMQYQWYHLEEMLPVENTGMLQIESVHMADTGQYSCVLQNQWGADTVEANLNVYPYREEVGLPEGPVHLCMGSEDSHYELPEDPLIGTYTWKLLPENAGVLEMDGRMLTVDWNPDFAGMSLLFAETSSGVCSGPNSDTLDIQLVGPVETPEICIVGMDEATGKYRVVWNKLQDESIIAYHIYRESNQAGVFLKLHTCTVDNFSVFVDSSSSPESLPHSYRISYSDTCGNESDLSPVHSTIHLSANSGIGGENNLIWSPYKGFAFLSYQIYRGTHRDSLELFQEVSSNVTSFSDLNPPAGRVYYQIVVSRDGACQPAKKSSIDYSTTRSNVFELFTFGIHSHSNDHQPEIYPNPASDYLWIKATKGSIDRYILQDITGKTVLEQDVQSSTIRVNTRDIGPGLYILKTTGMLVEHTAKIIIQ